MKRREFSTTVAAAAAAAAFASTAQAQARFTEGTHYTRLSQPLANAGAGKIEVVEFFWYGCPHCHAFEPALDAWQKKLPADVVFRRVPVAFRDEPFVAHQKLYYAIEALGLVDSVHRKVFYAIHNDRQRLDKTADIQAFMVKNGVDGAKFLDAFNSFGVQTKARQAKVLSEQYKIDGVPSLGVQGRWWTTASQAGSPDRMLVVADDLIAQSRRA